MGKTAIVIGSGAGGSMATRVLAKSGQFDTVTVLEKGPNYFQNLDSPNFSDVVTFFSNDEIKFGHERARKPLRTAWTTPIRCWIRAASSIPTTRTSNAASRL